MPERVVRIDEELASPCDVGASLDFGNDRGVRAEAGRPDDAAGEAGAENALDDEGLGLLYLPAGEGDREASADSGSGRAPVDLAFGEDADVAAVRVDETAGPTKIVP